MSKKEKPEEEKPEEKKPQPSKKKEITDLPWDKMLGIQGFPNAVLMYSHYFKQLGIPQKLTYGDWYFTLPDFKQMLYTKQDTLDTFEDLEFLTSGKYVRILTQSECWGIILACGYKPSMYKGFAFTFSNTDTTVDLRVETDNGDGLLLSGDSIYEVLIATAFRAYLICKKMTEFSVELLEPPVPTNPDEDDD